MPSASLGLRWGCLEWRYSYPGPLTVQRGIASANGSELVNQTKAAEMRNRRSNAN